MAISWVRLDVLEANALLRGNVGAGLLREGSLLISVVFLESLLMQSNSHIA